MALGGAVSLAGKITCPRYSTLIFKKGHLLNFSEILAEQSRERT